MQGSGCCCWRWDTGQTYGRYGDKGSNVPTLDMLLWFSVAAAQSLNVFEVQSWLQHSSCLEHRNTMSEQNAQAKTTASSDSLAAPLLCAEPTKMPSNMQISMCKLLRDQQWRKHAQTIWNTTPCSYYAHTFSFRLESTKFPNKLNPLEQRACILWHACNFFVIFCGMMCTVLVFSFSWPLLEA